jgi:nucleoside-diphosphate-sugar epimerase
VAVVGASGFVGSAVTAYLRGIGTPVRTVRAPRLGARPDALVQQLRRHSRQAQMLAEELADCSVVVNAAGLARATSGGGAGLYGANTLLPLVIEEGARLAGLERFIHISSAAVQGRLPRLTETATFAPTSAYARSKAMAEQALLAQGWGGTVILRATSVHGVERAISRKLMRLAHSPACVVASPGSAPTPQVHVSQVARAVGLLADLGLKPPALVLQPWEGFTTRSFFEMFAPGRTPHQLPAWACRPALAGAYALGRITPSSVWANIRRAEMLLFGQEQEPGWLDAVDPSLCRRHPDWSPLVQTLTRTPAGAA